MSLQIVRRPKAIQDLQDHFIYIGRHNLDAAHRFLDAADRTIHRLAEFPGLGIPCEFSNPRALGLRVQPISDFENFLAIYFHHEECIEIVRVLHASRDLAGVFERS